MKNRTILPFLPILLAALPLGAHDYEAPGAGGSVGGPVALSEVAIDNLGIATITTKIETIAKPLLLPGQLDLAPGQQARITAPYSGRIDRVHVSPGQGVRKGEVLLEVVPLTIGAKPMELKSPIDGFVLGHGAIAGAAFTSDDELLMIGNDSFLHLHAAAFPSPEAAQITSGTRGVLLTEAYPGEEFPVEVLERVIEPDTGMHSHGHWQIHCRVENPDRKLTPGLRGTLHFTPSGTIHGIKIPRRAVLGEMGNLYVYLRDENHFEPQAVTLGKRLGPEVEILRGLVPGDRVVVRGNYQLPYAENSPGAEEHDHDHDEHEEEDHGHEGEEHEEHGEEDHEDGDEHHDEHDEHDEHDHHHHGHEADEEALNFMRGLWLGAAAGIAFFLVVHVLVGFVSLLRRPARKAS